MITRRRLLLQITPMLDMLLLVMFLQFIDMKQKTAGLASEATATASALADSETQLAQAQADLNQVQQETDQARKQQAAVARMVAEIFRMTPDETKSLVSDLQPTGEISPATRDRIAKLAAGSPGPVVEHLMTFEEIRKRCDLWELYVDGDNVAHLDSGDRDRTLRVDLDQADDPEIEKFSVELETIYRDLPQPKHLVILLFSYHRDARLTVTIGVEKSLPKIVDRLTKASAGLTRFEYGAMGIRQPLD